MREIILKIENLSKLYRLGEVGTGTISHDLNRWWAKIRGKEDPYALVGQVNDRNQKAKSDYVWSLKDINFEVEQGEVLGIIGKNGAGKSTLLKIISQITSPTKGKIKAKGRIASLLEVGTGMNPELTARENIYLNGAILGMTKKEIESKFDEIIDFSGCAMYVDTPIKRFSSGMRVRLGFAVAAFLEPEILIVDEVLAVGDAEFQKKAIGKMKDISAGGSRTILFVSHNMAAVQNLCSRGILLKNGSIDFVGNVEETIQRYLNDNENDNSNQDLTTKARQGNGTLKFTHWSVSKTIDKKETTQLISGTPCFIQLYFESFDDLENVIFSIAIYSKTSKIFYTALRSDCINKLYNLKKNTENTVTFHLGKLPLTEGVYSFNVMAQTKYGYIDWVQDAGEITVINGDYYGTGILPASGRQGVLLDFDIILS